MTCSVHFALAVGADGRKDLVRLQKSSGGKDNNSTFTNWCESLQQIVPGRRRLRTMKGVSKRFPFGAQTQTVRHPLPNATDERAFQKE